VTFQNLILAQLGILTFTSYLLTCKMKRKLAREGGGGIEDEAQ